ncbi:aldolase [Acrocarpospora phusangensis]|uniref:Aldolase n=1 Tax=Acrocarpospora phusangensis TaxID=1070424 RepID=A0A919UJX7_9ACTN|nr:aldolase/citrate lyase family protein [Acrocarpospora phusangensis]GIH24346.1 aldolase [Acrocarpospora phusangensis]
MSDNPLIRRWRAGEVTYGVWCTVPGSVSAELIARQGPDYCCLDFQHGLIDLAAGVTMMQAVEAGGSIPVARVNWNEPNRIMQVLDAGARGVVVPMVGNAEEAARAARAFRFPPHGDRSWGPVRTGGVLGGTDPETLADQACILMIETADGIGNVREIAAVPGVDALYIGPSDLSLSLGLRPGHTPPDPRFTEVVDGIRTVCLENGIAAGIHCGSGEEAARYAEQGFTMITVGTDSSLLSGAVRGNLDAARGGTGSAGRAAGIY